MEEYAEACCAGIWRFRAASQYVLVRGQMRRVSTDLPHSRLTGMHLIVKPDKAYNVAKIISFRPAPNLSDLVEERRRTQ